MIKKNFLSVYLAKVVAALNMPGTCLPVPTIQNHQNQTTREKSHGAFVEYAEECRTIRKTFVATKELALLLTLCSTPTVWTGECWNWQSERDVISVLIYQITLHRAIERRPIGSTLSGNTESLVGGIGEFYHHVL